MCKEIQKRAFSEEYAQLENKEVASKKSKLQQLSPHLDEGLIQIGGCIKNAAIPDTTKHQYIDWKAQANSADNQAQSQ